MDNWICVTCGVQFTASRPEDPPADCPICKDDRQYVGPAGQKWTTRQRMKEEGHHNKFEQLSPGVTAITTEPKFAIGQRALLLQTPSGNILWDCITHLDAATISTIRQQGGLKAIAISHPHFYDTMLDWAEAFECPVYIHKADAQWVVREDQNKRITHFEGDTQDLGDGFTLVRLGGHFRGSIILHGKGPDGTPYICTGDTIQVTPDRCVSFMYSYPNLIPLPEREVKRMAAAIKPWKFDKVYGMFALVPANGSEVVQKSAERYIAALNGKYHQD